MARPRLNPRQKKWLFSFLSEYPYYKLRKVHEGLSGDRYLLLDGTEQLPLPLVPELNSAHSGYRLHTLRVQLRVYGDPRKTAIHIHETVYPHCNIDQRLRDNQEFGQLSLSIPAAVLEVPKAINPVIVTWKPKQKLNPKQGIQLSLPVTGLEAKVFELRQEKRPYLPSVSSQELLAEKVFYWSKRERKEIELPQVMVDLLASQNADDDEWQSAIDLFGVVGLFGAMTYIEGIPYLRKCNGTLVSTAAASFSVPVVTKAKSNSVQVKVFN